MVQIFSDKLTKILDKLAPVKTVQTRTKYAPWLSNSTKSLMKERDEAQRKAASTKHEDDWKTYKRLRNQVTSRPTGKGASYRTVQDILGNSGSWSEAGSTGNQQALLTNYFMMVDL